MFYCFLILRKVVAVSKIKGPWIRALHGSQAVDEGVGGAESKEMASGGQMVGGDRRHQSSAGAKQELGVGA